MYLMETCLFTSWNWHSTPRYVLLNTATFGWILLSRYFGYMDPATISQSSV